MEKKCTKPKIKLWVETFIIAFCLFIFVSRNVGYMNASPIEVNGCLIENNIYKEIIDINKLRDYVTPEMYGATGDGISDDTEAVEKAIKSGLPVKFDKEYVINSRIYLTNNCILFGNGKLLVKANDATVFQMTTNSFDYVIFKGIKIEMTQGSSLERQQVLFYNDFYNLGLLCFEDVQISMHGKNGFVVTNSACVEKYEFNNVVVNNLSTNSMGGCIWGITKIDTVMEINNCSFSQIPKDEILSLANHVDYLDATISCIVNNCSFERLNNPNVSRGFSVRGWSGNNIYMQFNNCSFHMAEDDNLLTMSSRGCLMEMNNCRIVGDPQVCVFGGYDSFDREKFDYYINDCYIETKVDVCGNYEHIGTQMASPNIFFNNCEIKGRTLFKVRNNTKSHLSLMSKAKNSTIYVDYLVETQGSSYGNMEISDCTVYITNEIVNYNTSRNKAFIYPEYSEFTNSNNIFIRN